MIDAKIRSLLFKFKLLYFVGAHEFRSWRKKELKSKDKMAKVN